MKMTGIEKRFVNSSSRARAVARGALELLDRIEVAPGWRFLDVGCGVGSAAGAIAERGDLDVTGVDVDPAQIAAASASATRPNLRFLAMDAAALEFGDAQFDVVASSMMTHHVRNWEGVVSEMARVLRPGGYLIYVDLMFPRWLARTGRLLVPLMGFPNVGGFEAIARQAGLVEVYQTRSAMRLRTIRRKCDSSDGGGAAPVAR